MSDKITKKATVEEIKVAQAKLKRIHALSELVSRAQLLSRAGKQYGGDRDLYETLGYLRNPTYADFYEKYKRQDIAKRINDAPVSATWRGRFEIKENEEAEETEFEKAWKTMAKNLRLFSKFTRLDRLVGLGSYGILLCGYNDIQQISELSKPVQVAEGRRKLLYVQPYSSESAPIAEYVKDPTDARYGLPRIYRVQLKSSTTNSTVETLVHYSRVIHVAEGLLEDEVHGEPRLLVGLNRLFDLEKIVGGSAEMFWRGARPGYALIADVDAEMDMGAAEASAFQDELDEFEHNLRRWLRLQGAEVQSLAPQVVSPKDHIDVQINMISAAYGIPKRILTGSERGELASSQDEKAWKEKIEDRRLDYAEDQIVRPFIDNQLEFGTLPALSALEQESGYTVKWSGLWEQTAKEKADISKTKSEALVKYTDSLQASMIFPPKSFFKQILGMSEAQIEALEEEMEGMVFEAEEE